MLLVIVLEPSHKHDRLARKSSALFARRICNLDASFETSQLIEQPIVRFVRDLGLIEDIVRIVMTTDRVTQVVNALGLSGTEASCRRPVRRTRRRYQFLVHGRGSPFHARYDLGLPRDISPWIKASATACSPPPEQRGCHGMRLRLGILEHGLLVWDGCATKADTRRTSLQPVRASTSHRTVESRESS